MRAKAILIMLTAFFMMIPAAIAVEDTCYWLDTNGDCHLAADDMTNRGEIEGAITGDSLELEGLNTSICPAEYHKQLWDVDGDGSLSAADIPGIEEAFQTATGYPMPDFNGAPSNLELDYDGGKLVATVTSKTGKPRPCIGVHVNGKQVFTDSNGKARFEADLKRGETIKATVNGSKLKNIPDMEAEYSTEAYPEPSEPDVTITMPSDDESVSGMTEIAWEIDDPDSDFRSAVLEYSPDKSSWTEILETSDQQGSVMFNTSRIDDGRYFLRLTAEDEEGLTGQDRIAISVDNTNEAPSVEIENPEDGEIITDKKDLEWKAEDPEDDGISISVSYSPGGDEWITVAENEDNDGIIEGFFPDRLALSDGEYRIRVTAHDGQDSSSSEIRVELDYEDESQDDDETEDNAGEEYEDDHGSTYTSTCGDNICLGEETCSNCPQDCGQCAEEKEQAGEKTSETVPAPTAGKNNTGEGLPEVTGAAAGPGDSTGLGETIGIAFWTAAVILLSILIAGLVDEKTRYSIGIFKR